MRYALRNQKKIKEALGEELLRRILESLEKGFKQYGEDIEKEIEIVEDHPYPILTLNDAWHTFNLVDFYVIKKQYDVYTLAFKEFIG